MQAPQNINVTQEQINILIEFMEQHGDISNTLSNSAQGRIRRQRLSQELVTILDNVGNGPKRSVDKWMKTWTDLKYRTKKKKILIEDDVRGTGGGPCRQRSGLSDVETRILSIMGRRAVSGGMIGEVGLAETSCALPENEATGTGSMCPVIDIEEFIEPPVDTTITDVLPQPVSGALQETSTTSSATKVGSADVQGTQGRKRRRTPSSERPLDRVAAAFAEIEEKRLQHEELRDRRHNELELKRLELDTLREKNLHERELLNAKIKMDFVAVLQQLVLVQNKLMDNLNNK